MQHDKEKYLVDIQSSLEILITFSGTLLNLNDYEKSDALIKDGVCRRLAIIGEALNKLASIDPLISTTDQKKIIGLRHIIVHDYDRIDDSIIYAILKKNLITLEAEINNLLNQTN